MSKTRTYLTYMDDEKLLDAIERLYQSYQRAFASKTLKELNKNIIDPFKFQFDTEFVHGGHPEETLKNEVFRQSDKSIANAIGLFHQQLLGSIDGFAESPDLPCDVRRLDDTVFAEVKNKFNTMNVRSAAGVYDELAGLAKSYPHAMCYLVKIIDKKSTDEVWSITINGTRQSHQRIHEISADRFYALATGRDEAFNELQQALPQAIHDFLAQQGNAAGLMESGGSLGVFDELAETATGYGDDIIATIYHLALPGYVKE